MENLWRDNVEAEKRTVFFFIDSLGGGGAERVVANLCNELSYSGRYNIEVLMLRKAHMAYPLGAQVQLLYVQDLPVISPYGKIVRGVFSVYKRIRQGLLKPILKKLGIYEKWPKIDETAFFIYANYALPYREYLRKNPGCTAFGFLIRSNIAMLMAAKGTGVRTVFCERNNPVRPDMPANIIKIRDRIYRRCSAAVFQTEEERAYYTKLRCKTAVIPNPLKEGLPERFTGERRHEIVNFCRLNKQKNIPLLIDAFELLHRDHPDYTLRIYGRGEEKDNLIAYAREKKLETSVSFEDFASDIHERVKDCAMFVCTSDYEGLSNSMLEALAIGLPSVCTDCAGGGARMMIRDHENGILVPVGDVQAVYHGMKEIVEDEALAQKLSEEASKLREQLSISRIVDRWEAMIE